MLGRHAEVVAELEALVGEHPLSERLRGQLMLALYRSGRQAEALVAYREARRTLVDELGIEPSPELRELEQSILRQEAGLSPGLPEPAPPPPRALRRRVTCLISDLTGSAALGELLDPEILRPLLIRCHETMRLACEKYGGTVHESIGDGVVAVFGVPVSHEDDALRAVLAADEMRRRVAELSAELEPAFGVALALRTGLSSGEVLTPGEEHGDSLVLGSAGSIAARLEQAAAPGEILLGETTRALLGDAVSVELAPIPVSGEPTPARAYRLLGPHARASFGRPPSRDAVLRPGARAPPSSRRLRSLGRRGLLPSRDRPGRARDRQVEARPRVAAAARLRGGLSRGPLSRVRGRSHVLARPGNDPAGGRAGNRSTSSSRASRTAPAVARGVAAALGLEEGVAGEEALWAFRRLFAEIARARPLVLVFEDVHYGQTALVDLVNHLGTWIRDAPVLILCLARPELLEARPVWAGGQRNAASLTLGPLSAEESRELLVALAGKTVEDAGLERIAATAGGNPLFLEQLLAHVGERDTGAAELGLPPALQALLAARLDLLGHAGALPPRARRRGGRRLPPRVGPHPLRGSVQSRRGESCFRSSFGATCFGRKGRRSPARSPCGFATSSSETRPTSPCRRRIASRCTSAMRTGSRASAPPFPSRTPASASTSSARAAWPVRSGQTATRNAALPLRRGSGWPRPPGRRTARGDLSGEIGFLDRAVALLGPDEPAAAELLAGPRLRPHGGRNLRPGRRRRRSGPSSSASGSGYRSSAGAESSKASVCASTAIRSPSTSARRSPRPRRPRQHCGSWATTSGSPAPRT